MKPGFLTDSSPVKFLNQVDNKRKKKKEIEKKISCWCFDLFEIVDVFSRKFIMLVTCLSSNLQILGPYGSLIYNPICVGRRNFIVSIQL